MVGSAAFGASTTPCSLLARDEPPPSDGSNADTPPKHMASTSPFPSGRAYDPRLSGCAPRGAIACADRPPGYARAVPAVGAVHRRFRASSPCAPLNRADAPHGSPGHFFRRFKGVSARRLRNHLMWFKRLHGAARVGDGTSLMRGQLGDVRYGKTWEKTMGPQSEFHPEPDVQTAG